MTDWIRSLTARGSNGIHSRSLVVSSWHWEVVNISGWRFREGATSEGEVVTVIIEEIRFAERVGSRDWSMRVLSRKGLTTTVISFDQVNLDYFGLLRLLYGSSFE